MVKGGFCSYNEYGTGGEHETEPKKTHLIVQSQGSTGRGAQEGPDIFNTERPHQAPGYRTPAEVFTSTPVEATGTGMVESFNTRPLEDSGTHS